MNKTCNFVLHNVE